MQKKNQQQTKTRMVHTRLSKELHRKLRIRAAENDMTIQDWVTLAIENELNRQDGQGARKVKYEH